MPMAQIFNNSALTELRYKNLRFLITDSPDDDNLASFVEVSAAAKGSFVTVRRPRRV
jgi:hypothetical protein